MNSDTTNPLHGKVTNIEVTADGRTIIDNETFYAGELAGFRKEIEESIKTNRTEILRHIMDALEIKSRTITITIHKNENYEPERLVKKVCVIDDRIGRKAKAS